MSGKNNFVTVICVFVAFVVSTSESANILCLYTSHSPSHLIVHMPYARALAERGHNVTIVTTLPLKENNPRIHHILIPPSEERLRIMDDMKTQMSKSKSALQTIKLAFQTVSAFGPMQYEVLKDQRFQDFMHNPDNKFDLMILGYFFSDYQMGVAYHFKCPIVLSWMDAPNLFVDQYVGNPPEISYVRGSPLLGSLDPLTFKGRLANFFTAIFSKLFAPILNAQMKSFYNDLFPDYPSMNEVGKKVSLLLCNSHFSEGSIRPNVPSLIEVGGIQIKDKPDPLPKDLQKVFNASSKHGVIYISFGSNLGSDNMSPALMEIIYKAVADLKQTVLWKWDGPKVPGYVKNIHYQKWLPQDDLLAQPNLRLFITHAGKGSVAESQYHGVPMVAIPVIADQPANADQLAKSGFGLKLDRNTMTIESLRAAIIEVIENPRYKETVKQFSALYRDRPMTARETAVYWIEYVIRHKGAYHMQSPLVHLNTLQYISADVVAFLLLVVYVTFKLLKITVKFVLSVWRCKKQKVKTQ